MRKKEGNSEDSDKQKKQKTATATATHYIGLTGSNMQTDRCGTSTLKKAAVKALEIVIYSHVSLLYQHTTNSLNHCV
jgi:hypothetical protein